MIMKLSQQYQENTYQNTGNELIVCIMIFN